MFLSPLITGTPPTASRRGHKVASLHGAQDRGECDAIIDRFRDGRDKILITTNVIARGIDIMQVNTIVNYDLPLVNEHDHLGNKGPNIETYIHRVGSCCFFVCTHHNQVRLTVCCGRAQVERAVSDGR